MNKTRVGVVIGRFQPITATQFETVIVPAIEENEVTIVILGSSFKPRTPLDPFDLNFRIAMIQNSIHESFDIDKASVHFAGVRDYLYDNTKWLCDVQDAVNSALSNNNLQRNEVQITLYGSALKGDYGFYNLFPKWNTRIFPIKEGENADTSVRDEIFDEVRRLNDTSEEHPFKLDSWREEVPGPAIDIIEEWLSGDDADRIVDEDRFIKSYIKNTQNGRYPIIFQTVDNVVIYKGNILLIERGARPGKGLLALPGGFLKHDLTFIDGAMKELREETRLRISKEWLVAEDRFGHPDRSLRGRTITQAFLWQIPDWKDVPQVRGSSDAKKAKWYELSDVLNNKAGEMFEDHLDIIESMIKKMR